MKRITNHSQRLITFFLAIMLLMAAGSGLPLPSLIASSMMRFFMNIVLVLALLPMLRAGMGVNYGLPIGILAGLFGMCLALEFDLTGWAAFLTSCLFAILTAIPFGLLYGHLLRRVRGQEEIAGLFLGFSAVFLMSFFWAAAPFHNAGLVWPIGGLGLRPTIGLKTSFGGVLSEFGAIHAGGVSFPVGGLLIMAVPVLLMVWFFRTEIGQAISALGENELFAGLSGIQTERYRRLAVILSTVTAALGICIYAQSYGFVELYEAPLMTAFPAASSILLGGSGSSRTSVAQVFMGTLLFQTVYVLSGPLANQLVMPDLSEIIRTIVTNGVILYALLETGKGERYEAV
ncbi:MAG: ABC transporter permease subunit [Solirubrobacterales bacterium]